MTHRLIDDLERIIRTENKHEIAEQLAKCHQAVLDNDMELIGTITDPLVITSLHQRLNERLKIPPRAMMLRNRVPARKQRALLFVKAMQNGVRRAE